MGKRDFIEDVAERSGLTKADARRAVEAGLEAIKGSLAMGEEVNITGFGKFEVRHRAARMGRNPQTGAPLHIPAMDIPGFKAGKGLKEAVR